MTWLAVRLPHLALDLLTRAGDHARSPALPIAISDACPRKPCILDCNPAAARLGVRAGLPVNAALALAEGLHVAAHDPQAEAHALQRLAAWCYQYSSLVSIQADRRALLLEAGASRRLFGTAEAISGRVTDALARLGYHAGAGSAPTPEAAYLAACLGRHIADQGALARLLRELPLKQLPLAADQAPALERMGFRKTGDVLRVPRRALARRLGPALSDYLDRLTGARPDPRRGWRPPERFSSGLHLPADIAASQALLFPMKRLIAEMCGVLRAGDKGVQEIHFRLWLRKCGAASQHTAAGDARHDIRLGLQQPCRDEGRFMLLLKERLERLRLPQPVSRIRLQAGPFLPFRACQGSLIETSGTGPGSLAALLERLQARLGTDAVAGLRGLPDHRPEHSWALCPPHVPADCQAMPHRPVWLLREPRPCDIGDYRILAGPERIETGWWDGHDCRRDYFVVRDHGGGTLWAYREYKPRAGWFIQGIFS